MEYTLAYSSLKGGDMGFSGGATARVLWRPYGAIVSFLIRYQASIHWIQKQFKGLGHLSPTRITAMIMKYVQKMN